MLICNFLSTSFIKLYWRTHVFHSDSVKARMIKAQCFSPVNLSNLSSTFGTLMSGLIHMFDLVGAISHFLTICQFANRQHMFVHFINNFNARISLGWDRVPSQNSRASLKRQGSQKAPCALTRTPGLGVRGSQVLSPQESKKVMETTVPFRFLPS